MDHDATAAADGHEVTLAASAERGATQELSRGTAVGRFLLLGRLGAGAMGVVYAAYDPELDRRIALKMMAGSGDSARMAREAQALARLAHPNIVAIHDVGAHGDRVWIAMEYVDGQTLGAWARAAPRGVAAVLRVLGDAARGVAAAHAAGLVHRDLKPENVMIDAGDRVRVMDFGLAHGRLAEDVPSDSFLTRVRSSSSGGAVLSDPLTRDGAVQGTPAYMAPEQWRGEEVGPAADQFSWCVMAWELLYGERPYAGAEMIALINAVTAGRRRPPPRGRGVPSWLRRILERGLDPDPERRWPSMTALLAALRRGRGRARVRRVVVALAVIAGIAALALVLRERAAARAIAACVEAGAEIDATWSADARRRLADAVAAERVAPWFDQQAASWRRARGVACLEGEVYGRWDAELRARSLGCLEDRRLALAALIDELARADARVALRAVAAAAALPPVEPCVDVDRLRRLPSGLPDDHAAVQAVRVALARADALRLAGRYGEALDAARGARDEARALGWSPLIEAAGLLVARLEGDTGAHADAEATATEVYYASGKIGAWEIAADAATLLTHYVGNRRGDLAGGVLWARDAELAIGLAGDQLGLREAARVNSLANAHGAARRYEIARDLHAQALELRRRALGAEHPDVAWALNNLAIDYASLGEPTRAQALHEEALALRRRILGPDHPDVAFSLFNLASLRRQLGDLDGAEAMHGEALTIRERALGGEHPDVAQSLNSLALVRAARGDFIEARRLHLRALALRERLLGGEHLDVAQSLINLGDVRIAQGEYADAAALLERALAIREKVYGPDHLETAAALFDLGVARRHLGDLDGAAALQRRAEAIFTAVKGGDHATARVCVVERALGLLAGGRGAEALPLLERAVAGYDADPGGVDEAVARFALARALVATGGDPGRAVALAERAEALRGALPRADLDGLDAWIAARRAR